MHEVLAYYKKTEGKFRWDAIVDDTKFEFYIPKWRVPSPTPRTIRVKIYRPGEEHPLALEKRNENAINELLEMPINAKIAFTKEHTKTIRYDPIWDKKEWNIGSPYIPKSLLLPDIPKQLTLIVEWR